MKLTKLVHSCLLVETNGKRLLVDPGSYSWNSGLVNESHIKDLDYVVITHMHPDHFDETFIKAVRQASPKAKWFCTPEAVIKLGELDISAESESDDENIKFIKSEHADHSPWFKQQPEHTSFVLFNELLIGGDCHTLTKSHGARFFGGAINGGPWGAVVGFAKMIEEMSERPEVVIPLHDWHFNDEARVGIYNNLPKVLADFGVKFVPLENGNPQEI